MLVLVYHRSRDERALLRLERKERPVIQEAHVNIA